MRVLIVHNYYQQPGGEDLVFADEARILYRGGHDVFTWKAHNRIVTKLPPLRLAPHTLWSISSRRKLSRMVKRHRIEVVHFHNTFPLISPGAHWAVRKAGAAVVQTLHNYRLLCANAQLFRKGEVCLKCVSAKLAWPAIRHRCYHGSVKASSVAAAMISFHRLIGTWTRQVDRYIALTDASRILMTQAMLPADKVAVKPNCVDPDPGKGTGPTRKQPPYALFVGRLTAEKGVDTLLEAWQDINPDLQLKIAGEGPLKDAVTHAADQHHGIEYLGHRKHEEIIRLMQEALCVVVPSQWLEPFGRTVIESLACGTPVIATRIASLPELVEAGRTGLLFKPADVQDLRLTLQHVAANPAAIIRMRPAARAVYEEKYTAKRNLRILETIYQEAVEQRRRTRT